MLSGLLHLCEIKSSIATTANLGDVDCDAQRFVEESEALILDGAPFSLPVVHYNIAPCVPLQLHTR